MQNRWNETHAAAAGSELDLRVYSSRLIGCDRRLVLHGGGNTSLKGRVTDRFGEVREVIWVKASGYDLATAGADGYTALALEPVRRLAELEQLPDGDMVAEIRRAQLDPGGAQASIEAIVHALFPFAYVDHSHADGVLTLSNIGGRALLETVLGPHVLILPYVKPGFALARQIRDCLSSQALSEFDALILEHHGVFTWGDTARESYERMIAVCEVAEDWLAQNVEPLPEPAQPDTDSRFIARLRGAVSRLAGTAVISAPAGSVPVAEIEGLAAHAKRGTLTPEHVIHNKPFPAIIRDTDLTGLAEFADDYRAYVAQAEQAGMIPLPPNPNWSILPDGSVRSFGPNLERATTSADVAAANVRALRIGDRLGGWQGLSEADLRDLEYWELEQAKLRRKGQPAPLSGKIAVVTGAAAGIGQACCRRLRDLGAVVVGMDRDPGIREEMNAPGFESVVAELTDEPVVSQALADVVRRFGGLDILVSNAGIFRTGAQIESLTDEVWDETLAVNLTSHRKVLKQAVPYLRHGVNPSVVFIGSRNVPAPGAGAAAYSVSKAGLTQMMRVAALELSPEGITVNMVHPDAVFDTRLWTEEALQTSARRYGLTVEEYKSRNLMAAEVTSADVARAVGALVDGTFARTTGAQIPVDGGNNRVI